MKLKYDETWKGHKMVYQTLGVPQEAVTIYGMVRDIPIDDFKDKNGQRFRLFSPKPLFQDTMFEVGGSDSIVMDKILPGSKFK